MSELPKLRLRVHGVSNSLWSEDLAAVPRAKRTWSVAHYVSLWISMSLCIPAYMLASGLVALGMDWSQALGTILLGNLVVLAAVILNAYAGAKYGIPFAVYLRASFGVVGAHLPAVVRALVASGWFGIQCWIGGEALFRAARLLLPKLDGGVIWWCFAAFWLLHMLLADRKIERSRLLQNVSAGCLLMVMLALFFWMADRTRGLGIFLGHSGEAHSKFVEPATAPEFSRIFLSSLTATIGFWSAVVVNISDSARCARSQKAQSVGQAIGLPAAMTLYSFVAIAVTTATVVLTPDHRAMWNPIELIASFPKPAVALLGLLIVILATLQSNLATNLASPSAAFSNLLPNAISFRLGTLITGVLSIVWMPWRLIGAPEAYIDRWLVGSSGLLGPIAGIMIADFFVVRGRWLDLDDLYVRGGIYEYRSGWNTAALAALLSGTFVALLGFFVPRLHWLYECAWFVGSLLAAGIYLLLMRGPDVRAMIPPTPLLIPVEGFEPESPMA